MNQDLVLQSLVCHAAVEMARRGFAALVRCSDRPIRLVVHDDGSLEPEDYDVLQDAVKEITFVDRRTADATVEPLLSKHPVCRAFRRRNPLALKLLDIPLLATGDDVAYCDTDVLAFRPFCGVFEWPDPETTGVFMQDTQNAYALRPWHLAVPGIALPMHVNTGLMLFRTSHHDLDFLEWFLGRQLGVYQRLPGWVEQTGWAALAQRGRCRLYDASHVRVIKDAHCLGDPALVLGHFTQPVRALWPDAGAPPSSPLARIRVRTSPALPLTASHFAAEHVRRAAKRSLRWIRRRAPGIAGA